MVVAWLPWARDANFHLELLESCFIRPSQCVALALEVGHLIIRPQPRLAHHDDSDDHLTLNVAFETSPIPDALGDVMY